MWLGVTTILDDIYVVLDEVARNVERRILNFWKEVDELVK